MGDTVRATRPPGDPPRVLSFSEWFPRLPMFLQIGGLVLPLCIIGTLVWMYTVPSRDAFTAFVPCIAVVPLWVVWAWRYRNRLMNFAQVQATVEEFRHPEDSKLSHLIIIDYRYVVDGESYPGAHWAADRLGLDVGDRLWILHNPAKPDESVAWGPVQAEST